MRFSPRLGRRIKTVPKFLIIISLIIVAFIFGGQWILDNQSWTNYLGTGFIGNIPKSYKNYFLNPRMNSIWTQLIVNTSNCEIADFDVWDQDILPLVKTVTPIEDCRQTSYNWSYTEHDVLIMNLDAIKNDGYAFSKLNCCYKIIRRDNGPNIPNDRHDNSVSYSGCIQILKERTKIQAEFIMVECSGIFPWPKHYRGYHGIATPELNQRKTIIEEKIDFWKGKEELPPNILMIGIDSTSRLNLRRSMKNTVKVLESLGAVELLGYTKVGENTRPNFLSLFTGYDKNSLEALCVPAPDKSYMDACPLIWKEMDKGKYLTGIVEDAPDFTAFNFQSIGFSEQPVDFYARPLFLAAHEHGPFMSKTDHLDCISQNTNDEAILAYLESVMDFSHKSKTPVFSLSWATTNSHGDFNMIQLVDDSYANFLHRLMSKGYLNNTILFFLGDHGYRFTKFRETLIGFYEDKLPAMWARYPPTLIQRYPEWQEGLEINAKYLKFNLFVENGYYMFATAFRRLTSPYHLYWTLVQFLKTFTNVTHPESARLPKTNESLPRKYNLQNFLQAVPEDNSCSDVGIEDRFCACYRVQSLPTNDPVLLEGAQKAVAKINNDLRASGYPCEDLVLSRVNTGAVMKTSESTNKYIIGFIAQPGDILVEGEIEYFVQNQTFGDAANVQRTSRINQRHIRCIHDSAHELFCVCRDR